MPSKKSTRLASSALYVESSVEKNDEAVDQALAERYGGLLEEGETMPDFQLTMRLIQRDLAAHRRAVTATDVANLEELAGDDAIRKRKDTLVEEIYGRITRWRGMFDRAYEPGKGLELAGIEKETATDLMGILRQGKRVVERCRQQVETGFGDPDLKGAQLAPQEIVDDLHPLCDELNTLTKTLNREERDRQETQIAKDRTEADHVKTFVPSAGVLQAFYLLAGFPELAAQVKPSTRRPGRRAVETAADDGEADGGGDDTGQAPAEVGPQNGGPPSGSPPAGNPPDGGLPAVNPASTGG